MSEFSDSLHVVDRAPEAVATVLRTLGIVAAVLPRVGRHTTVLLAPADLPKARLSLRGLTMLYDYAADHALSVTLYRGDAELARIARSFEGGKVRFDRDAWMEAGLLDAEEAVAVEEALQTDECAAGVASALGLRDAEWVSGRDVTEGLAKLRERFPGILVVGVEDYSQLGASIRVVCAMSPQRQALLQEEPELVDDLLDARHEQPIAGLHDLGLRTPQIAELLGKPLAEAVVAASGARVPGTHAVLLLAPVVKQLAEGLRALDQNKLAWEPLGARARKTQQDLDALIALYVDAAAKGYAVMVVTE